MLPSKKSIGRGRGRGRRSEQNNPPGQPNQRIDQARGEPGENGNFKPSQFPSLSPECFADSLRVQEPARPESIHPPSVPSNQNKTILNGIPAECGTKLRQNSGTIATLPIRPSFGELGRRIRVVSNCFPIKVPNGNVYCYYVQIKLIPNRQYLASGTTSAREKTEKAMIKRNRKVISHMLNNSDKFDGLFAAYDGLEKMYTRRELKEDFPLKCEVSLFFETTAGYSEEPRKSVYEVIIWPAKKPGTVSCAINLDSIHDLYNKRTTSVPRDAVMALDTILRHGPNLQFTPICHSYFYPPNPRNLHPLGGGLEVWFGYHQSVRLGQWKPTVNLDVAATVFLQEGPVLNYIAKVLNKNVQELSRIPKLNEVQLERINTILKQKQIKVTHLGYPRKYRIIKLLRENADEKYVTVNGNTEKKILAHYFKERHGIVLQYPNLPCVHVQPEDRNICLPVEVCHIVAGQRYTGELSSNERYKMIKFTSASPKMRFKEIDNIRNKANFENDANVREFDLEVSGTPLSLEARVLDSPSLLYRNQQIQPSHGSWDVRRAEFLDGARIGSWTLLVFSDIPHFKLMKLAELVTSIGRKFNMNMGYYNITTCNNLLYDKVRLLSEIKEMTDFVFVVLPRLEDRSYRGIIYSDIKRAAETVIGLTTQFIKEHTLNLITGPNQSRGAKIVRNLCQKINAKLGGENNCLVLYETPSILWKPVMIIGCAISYPRAGEGENELPIMTACVGSVNSLCKRFTVSVRSQEEPTEKKTAIEIIRDLEGMVVELLVEFYRYTGGKRPEKIIVYRDGIREDNFENVKMHEVVSVRKACRKLQSDYEPGITFIVVNRRHRVRFKPEDPSEGIGNNENLPPGTVVDTDVSHPVNFDFILCSQAAIQGTSRPSQYTVIEDDNEFTADDIQKLTYQLCHIYVRCNKSMSAPAPVFYAYLAARRARVHLQTSKINDPSSSSRPLTKKDIDSIKVVAGLKNSMYFV